MKRLMEEGYKGYTKGRPLNCTKNSSLIPTMGDTKKFYNFSYYNEDGSPGVIGSNGFCVPTFYTGDYEYYSQFGQWGKHLAQFIDKVLQATGAQKVNIVAHSMGGLVARSAIAYYGAANKVNKLILIGTPNDEYNENPFIEALITYVMNPVDWMKKGELLEMGINYWGPIYGGVLFKHGNAVATWCDWLYFNDPRVPTVTIAGNNAPWYTSAFGENDGVVKVSQVKLDYAQFNPVIYARHGWIGGEAAEVALPYTTYVYEFIKKWMIEGVNNIYGESPPEGSYVYSNTPNNPDDKVWRGKELRIRLRRADGTNCNYSKILTLQGIL